MKKVVSILMVMVLAIGQISTAKPIRLNKKQIAPPRKFGVQKPVPLYPSRINNFGNREDIGLTIGIKAGSSAGLTGAMGEVSYSLMHMLPGASLRGGFGYLTKSSLGEDDSIKIATVNLDGVYDLGFLKNPDVPFNMYIGGGLIYPWKVSKNKGNGAWGAHAYLGGRLSIEKSSSVYGELAYSGIKYSKEQSAIRGIEAMLGYGYSF